MLERFLGSRKMPRGGGRVNRWRTSDVMTLWKRNQRERTIIIIVRSLPLPVEALWGYKREEDSEGSDTEEEEN